MKKLVLLDAYALIFRAYYAFIRSPRINSQGQNTSAIFGFVNTLDDILRTEQPDYVAVAFDLTGQKTTDFRIYLGPNHYNTLKAYDKGVEKADRLHLKELVPLGRQC